MAGLKVFFDSFSQPSRAVLLLLHANKIPYEPHLIKIAQMENRTNKEFAAVNPNKKVPAINDNGFCLSESGAILKYLCQKYKLPDHWYPSDLKRQAKVDEYLNWHHTNLRVGAAYTLFMKVFLPRMTGQEPDQQRVEENEKIFKRSKRLLEEYFLKDSKFIGGMEEISIADLQALCEFTSYWVASADPCEGRPRLTQWLEDCKNVLQPHFDEVHKMIYMARDQGIFKGKL